METELKRSMEGLHQVGYPRPYYVGLTAADVEVDEFKCSMGALLVSGGFRQRLLLPDVRVGGYEFDNHPLAPMGAFLARPIGRDEDEFSLRYGLWSLLDGAYKAAAADFLRKQALRLRRGKTEYDTDDMTREAARLHEAEQPPASWKPEELKTLCLEASRQFRARPGLLQMEASAKVSRHWRRLRDSEGSKVDFGRDMAEVELEAVDLSTDGLRLFASRKFVAVSGAGLPGVAQVRHAAREMMRDLDAQKAALSTAPFSAPALLDPSVSAALVLAMGSRLTGEEQRHPAGAQIFRGKLGQRILPADISLVDDPTLPAHAGEPLAGAYAFDDQGVAARRVVLIENGVLKDFLLSRYPVVGAGRSNGHARGPFGLAPVAGPGSLFLSSARPAAQAELLDLLRRECRKRAKPYGIWMRQLRSWNQQQAAGAQGSIRLMGLVYLVEAETGRMFLVRDLDVVGTPLVLMSNILKAGDDVQVHNVSFAGGPVSVVAPSLLFQDVELQRAETKPERAPVLPPPPVDLADVPGAVPERLIRVPTAAASPYVLARRYILRGKKTPAVAFVMEGLLEMRQSLAGEDLILDAKLFGKNGAVLNDAARRMDRSVERLSGGLAVEKSDLAPAMTRAAYEAQWGRGWPR